MMNKIFTFAITNLGKMFDQILQQIWNYDLKNYLSDVNSLEGKVIIFKRTVDKLTWIDCLQLFIDVEEALGEPGHPSNTN